MPDVTVALAGIILLIGLVGSAIDRKLGRIAKALEDKKSNDLD